MPREPRGHHTLITVGSLLCMVSFGLPIFDGQPSRLFMGTLALVWGALPFATSTSSSGA